MDAPGSVRHDSAPARPVVTYPQLTTCTLCRLALVYEWRGHQLIAIHPPCAICVESESEWIVPVFDAVRVPKAPERSQDVLIAELLYAARDSANESRIVCNPESPAGRAAERVAGIVDRIVKATTAPDRIDEKPHPSRRKEDSQKAASADVGAGTPPRTGLVDFGEPWTAQEFTNRVKHGLGNRLDELVALVTYAQHADGPEYGERQRIAARIAACVNFCAGIPTETLAAELPLASEKRRRWDEIMHLRKALPWLPPVTEVQG